MYPHVYIAGSRAVLSTVGALAAAGYPLIAWPIGSAGATTVAELVANATDDYHARRFADLVVKPDTLADVDTLEDLDAYRRGTPVLTLSEFLAPVVSDAVAHLEPSEPASPEAAASLLSEWPRRPELSVEQTLAVCAHFGSIR